MLSELFPRHHVRFLSLPLLGPLLEDLVGWLRAQGFPDHPIRMRVRATTRLDALLRRDGVMRPDDLSAATILAYAPRDSQDDIDLAALVRSLVRYLGERGRLLPTMPTPSARLTATYAAYLGRVRGLARSTVAQHEETLAGLLGYLGYDRDTAELSALDSFKIDGFVQSVAQRRCRAAVQHTVAQLRSSLRYLESRGDVAAGLGASIDTPRVYRGERLPRCLPWEMVGKFLAAIDRSSPMGRRDFAMFLLIATYGLRTCEVAGLRLDDIEWRARRIRVSRSKTASTLALPLTDEVAAAILAYLKEGRPALGCRQVFLRVRAPSGPLEPTGVTEAFQACTRRSGLPISYQGPHCLRHSLAVHLLRTGVSLKAIGDILGHRSAESTCVYLRLHVEDLRDTALGLPQEATG